MARDEVIEHHFHTHYDNCCKSLVRRSGSYENSEDIVQEAYARALKHWETWDENRGVFATWFNTILQNALKDFLRADRNSGMGMSKEEEGDGENALENAYLDKQAAGYVRKAIRAAPGETGRALELYFLKGYKPKDIYEVVDMPPKTVRQYIWRFRKRMEEELGTRNL